MSTTRKETWIVINNRFIIPASWIEEIDSAVPIQELSTKQKFTNEYPKSDIQCVYQLFSIFTEINYLENQGLMKISTTCCVEFEKMFQQFFSN